MFQIKRKQLIFFILFSLLTPIAVLVFYFAFFYFPLKNNKEIFPKTENEEIFVKEDIPQDMKKMYGITFADTEKEKSVYFIDGREKEEYDVLRLKKSVNLRAPDIMSADDIIRALKITRTQFNNSLVVIYCHDGRRSMETAAKINLPNVKFLVDGRLNFLNDSFLAEGSVENSPFSDHIKDYDFTISLDDFSALIKNKNYFLVDGRLDDSDVTLSNVYKFRIGYLSTEEYNEKIKTFIELGDKDIMFIANSYPDLFYAKLLVYRLERDYGFNYKKFHVILGQDNNISKILNDEKN